MKQARRKKREERRGKREEKKIFFFHLPSSFFLLNSRGSVLIATVWILLVLSIFSVAVHHRASQQLVFGRWAKELVETRMLAKAGVKRALLEIQLDKFLTFDSMNESWASNEKAFKKIQLQEGTVTIFCDPEFKLGTDEKKDKSKAPALQKSIQYGACDEASRININIADEEVLTNLFMAAVKNMDHNEAVTIAQSIIDWRDPDDAVQQSGAESNFYRFLTPSYAARNGPFESVEELTMVRGVTRDIYNQVKNYVTVYTDGKTNFNTASSIVFQALGLSSSLADRIVEFRKGPDETLGNEDDGVFQMLEGITPALSAKNTFTSEDFAQIAHAMEKNLVGVKSKVFRIQSIGRLNRSGQDVQTLVTCVSKRNGMILYWHEGN